MCIYRLCLGEQVEHWFATLTTMVSPHSGDPTKRTTLCIYRLCLGEQIKHGFAPHSSDPTNGTRWRKSLAFGLLCLGRLYNVHQHINSVSVNRNYTHLVQRVGIYWLSIYMLYSKVYYVEVNLDRHLVQTKILLHCTKCCRTLRFMLHWPWPANGVTYQ